MLRADFNPVLAATFSSVLVVIPLSIETIFTSISTKAYDFIFFYLSYLRYYISRIETIDIATHCEAIIDRQQSSVLFPTSRSRMYYISILWIPGLRPSLLWSVKFPARLATRITPSIISSNTSIFERQPVQQRPANLIDV